LRVTHKYLNLITREILLDKSSNHIESIIDQFTKQANPFAKKLGHSDERAFKLMYDLTKVTDNDHVLDVACGPGLVSCAFAKIANHVTGVDITPAMIEQAKLLQSEKLLNNLTWNIGNAYPLVFPDESFSLVITRYSFHHFLEPEQVLSEMIRVCRQGGRIAIIDVTPRPDKAEAYDYIEKLRDPSHVRAMPFNELLNMVKKFGLVNISAASYRLESELEEQITASFPHPGHEEKIRQLIKDDLGTDKMDLKCHKKDGKMYFSYPTSIIVASKP
jgi:ubiquinone/menaquinone biosynthesis C-methylase UbiE